MKLPAIVILTTLAGLTARGNASLTVCMGIGMDGDVTNQAQLIAGKMFSDIGIETEWREARQCPPRTDAAIWVTPNTGAPKDYLPGALAFTQLSEQARVVVLYDRVRESAPRGAVPPLLAHVLVHEITHILENSGRHSASGVMKSYWDLGDLREMERRTLPFTGEDVILIRLGLASRASRRAAVAMAGAKPAPTVLPAREWPQVVWKTR